MSQRVTVFSAITLAAVATILPTPQATAAGCNGYVNQFEWGCAPWDNNNGPQYPHYKGSAGQQPRVAPNAGNGTQGNDPKKFIGNDAGSFIGNDAGSFIGNGAGTLQSGGKR